MTWIVVPGSWCARTAAEIVQYGLALVPGPVALHEELLPSTTMTVPAVALLLPMSASDCAAAGRTPTIAGSIPNAASQASVPRAFARGDELAILVPARQRGRGRGSW